MSTSAQTPGFDDTWAQWDEAHPRTSRDSAQHPRTHGVQALASENVEIFHELNPWESQVDLSAGSRRNYGDGATIGMA